MDKKKLLCIIIVVVLLISALYLISPFNRSYSIDNANINMKVSNAGKLYVTEEYDYTFNGEYNGVYRNLPLHNTEDLDYFNVNVDGAYPVVEKNQSSSDAKFKIYLYSDPQHTQKIKNCKVHVTYQYCMKNVVYLYKDVGTLQYKLWDKDWDVGIKNMKVAIQLPGNKDNIYFVNPEKYTKSSNINGNMINIEASDIPKGKIYELLVLMPANNFNKVSFDKYHYHPDENAKDRYIDNLEDSLNQKNESEFFWNSVTMIYLLLIITGPAILIYAYNKYGKEPEVDYEGIYERELPTDESPEFVNAVFGKTANIGEATMAGFEASILNLIDRKVIDLKTQKDDESDSKDMLLTFNENKKSELSSSELILFDTLSAFATEDNVLSLSRFKQRLKSQSNAKWFMKHYDSWVKNFKKENKEKINLYFNTKGSSIATKLGVIYFILGIILFFIGGITPIYEIRIANMILGVIIGIIGIVSFCLPDDYVGSWTPEGRVAHLKWENFKKFLQDNSLIEEHPPESIVVWKKYLIYGSALGLASTVHKSMQLHVPNVNEYDDGVVVYHFNDGFSAMHSAIKTGEYSANPSDSSGGGGSGSFGGGSGGGGGGAF